MAFAKTQTSDRWAYPVDAFVIHPENSICSLLMKEIRKIIRETFDRSSLHGFPSLASKHVSLAVKVFWVVCVAASWSYFSYQAYNTIALYQSFPKVTQISMVKEPVVDFAGKHF